MLKCLSRAMLLAIAFSLIGCGCGRAEDVSFYGLIEGTYSFVGAEGTLPEGWSFDEESRFDFVCAGTEEEFDKKAILPRGVWQNDKSNGKSSTYRNYHMVWKNTPFDTRSGLKAGGMYTTPGVCHRVMYDNSASKPGEESEWEEYSWIVCAISSLREDDISKRKVVITFVYRDEIKLPSFNVTFSM